MAGAGNVLNTTSIEKNDRMIPSEFKLLKIYPNPFNPITTIKYTLEKPGHVYIKIYNLNGQEVETLINRYHIAGEHQIIWQPKGIPSGLYYCRLNAGEFSETKKVVLLK
jgi:hypothetical protein